MSCVPDANVRAEDIVLEFAYGSENEQWITDVTRAYNAAGHEVNGKRVRVNPSPMGSGEAIEEMISGTRKSHLVSPASGAFIELGNAESRAKTGGKDLVKETKNLVLSPVVIAMWKPMAQALGWPDKPIGWSDVLKLARAQGLGDSGPSRVGLVQVWAYPSGIQQQRPDQRAGRGLRRGWQDREPYRRGRQPARDSRVRPRHRAGGGPLRQLDGVLRQHNVRQRPASPQRGRALREPGHRVVRPRPAPRVGGV